MNHGFYVSKLHLTQAAEHALICHFSPEGGQREFHAQKCRDETVKALSGCAAGERVEAARERLLDTIADEITFGNSAGSTDRETAQYVLDALLDSVAPMPAVKEAAA